MKRYFRICSWNWINLIKEISQVILILFYVFFNVDILFSEFVGAWLDYFFFSGLSELLFTMMLSFFCIFKCLEGFNLLDSLYLNDAFFICFIIAIWVCMKFYETTQLTNFVVSMNRCKFDFAPITIDNKLIPFCSSE